jgi:hypothetical protein
MGIFDIRIPVGAGPVGWWLVQYELGLLGRESVMRIA